MTNEQLVEGGFMQDAVLFDCKSRQHRRSPQRSVRYESVPVKATACMNRESAC